MLTHWLGAIHQALPLLCPGCLQYHQKGTLCPVCRSYLESLHEPCPSCSAPDCSHSICGSCLKDPPAWDNAHIAWQFSGLVRHLIHQFKYQKNMAAGSTLLSLWMDHHQHIPKPEAIVAVPMYHRKHQQRGFNQALWMAQRLSTAWQLPRWNGIQRTMATESLEGLNKKQRRQTLKNAFTIVSEPPKMVAIVDDVFTSGATASEISRLLKRQGVEKISIWALARTPLSTGL